MKKNEKNIKALSLNGLCIALAFVLSYLETLIPIQGVPGMKLGLTNLVVIIALYYIDVKSALTINIVRIFLVSITFGNMVSLWYAMAGGVLSFVFMLLLMKTRIFSVISVSVAGGVAHNAGQILVAMLVLQTRMLSWYFGVLCISGVITGAIIGGLSGAVLSKLLKFKQV